MSGVWRRVIAVATVGTHAALVAAPALAQQVQYGQEVSATGVVEGFGGAYGDIPYGLRDEATGTVYYFEGDGFDFGAYRGERVTAYGTYERIGQSAVLNVTSIEPVGEPGEEFTARFELRVEGAPPEGAAFSGVLPFATGALTDSDGDGLYTGSASFPKSYTDVDPEDGVSDDLIPVAIFGGMRPDSYGMPLETLPGEKDLVVVDFGKRKIRHGQTFSASYSFEEASANGQTGGENLGVRIVGTSGPNEMQGGAGDDLLVGRGGADRSEGGAGDDALYAAFNVPAEDAPVAPAAPDLILGGAGDDFVDAADTPGAPDEVYCGPGDDLAEADADDFVASDCEEVNRY